MARSYDSSRRRRAAEHTRQDIVRAAIKLHWDGITDFDAMAAEARCSVSTVRKHYPTREHLFHDCTRAFGETLEMPIPEEIARIADRGERVARAIGELLRIHEAMFGYAWLGARARDGSPTLDAVMRDYEALADAIGEVIAPSTSDASGLVRGLLDFLTYRALRTRGGLSPEQACTQLHDAVCVAIGLSPPDDDRRRA